MTTILEVRGRGDQWKVYYPNEDSVSSPVQVFDREGIFKEMVYVAGPGTGMTEANFVGTAEAAEEYARAIAPGCEIKRISTDSARAAALEKARAARRLKAEAM